jgi:hypothetical protein
MGGGFEPVVSTRALTLSSKMKKTTAFLVLTLLAKLNLLAAPLTTKGLEPTLTALFPGSFTVEGRGRNILGFCPDNTCIEFGSETDTGMLLDLATAYLYYFADDYALKTWRDTPAARDRVAVLARKLELGACLKQSLPSLNCVRTKLKKHGLRVYDVRYDEGVKARSRVW